VKTEWRKVWGWIVNAAYLLAAVGCFGLALYSIWLDRAGSAGVAATFAVAFLFLRHLPIIESFKAFNMEAKFARRVDEFDKLLAYIRSVAEVTSELLYMQLGYSGRWMSIDWDRKREFMGQLDRNLSQLGVDDNFIREAKRPVLNFASADLYSVFRGTAQTLSTRLRQEVVERQRAIQQAGPIDPSNPEWLALHERNGALLIPHQEYGDFSRRTSLENMCQVTSEVLEKVPWPPRERAILDAISKEIGELATACWEQGTVTPEAEAYIKRYGENQEDRLKEMEKDMT
jgi:hypothetical protein